MKRLFAVLMLCLLMAGCGPAPTPQELIDESNANYRLLLATDCFYYNVAAGSDIPAEISAFSALFAHEDSWAYFMVLEEQGGPAGQLYALCGLYYLDYEYYRERIDSYCTDERQVLMDNAGIRWTTPVKSIILREALEEGDVVVRLDDNTVTLESWLQEQQPTSYILDFYGGGIPELLSRFCS